VVFVLGIKQSEPRGEEKEMYNRVITLSPSLVLFTASTEEFKAKRKHACRPSGTDYELLTADAIIRGVTSHANMHF
jgi:hypothetical protein